MTTIYITWVLCRIHITNKSTETQIKEMVVHQTKLNTFSASGGSILAFIENKRPF
jgi:hypothetical protein